MRCAGRRVRPGGAAGGLVLHAGLTKFGDPCFLLHLFHDRTLLASLWPDLWGARVSNDPGLPDRHAPVPGGRAPLRGAASYEAEG